jgi:hypothetical protein
MIVETLRNQFQYVAFARGELDERTADLAPRYRLGRYPHKVLKLANNRLPCWLAVHEKLIAAFEWDEARSGNQGCKRSAFATHGKEFSSVTDEFLPPCQSHLRAIGVCDPPT